MSKTSTKIIIGVTSMACFAGFAAYNNDYDHSKKTATVVSKISPATEVQVVQPAIIKVEPQLAQQPITSVPPAPAKTVPTSGYQAIKSVAPKVAAPPPIIVAQADTVIPAEGTTPDTGIIPDTKTAPVPQKSKNTKTRAS